ncbi:MAG: hypothetical protein ACFCBW_01880, partial [Candidatus Competibacterales bacterium]
MGYPIRPPLPTAPTLPNFYTLPCHTVALGFGDELQVAFPLLAPAATVVTADTSHLPWEWMLSLEHHALRDAGNYLELIPWAQTLTVGEGLLAVAIPRGPEVQEPLELTLELPYLHGPLPSKASQRGQWGLIPALGVGALALGVDQPHGETPLEESDLAPTPHPSLVAELQGAVKQALMRQRRLDDPRRLMALQWYRAMTLHRAQVEVGVWSAVERDRHRTSTQTSPLREAARPLAVPRRQHCFGRA